MGSGLQPAYRHGAHDAMGFIVARPASSKTWTSDSKPVESASQGRLRLHLRQHNERHCRAEPRHILYTNHTEHKDSALWANYTVRHGCGTACAFRSCYGRQTRQLLIWRGFCWTLRLLCQHLWVSYKGLQHGWRWQICWVLHTSCHCHHHGTPAGGRQCRPSQCGMLRPVGWHWYIAYGSCPSSGRELLHHLCPGHLAAKQQDAQTQLAAQWFGVIAWPCCARRHACFALPQERRRAEPPPVWLCSEQPSVQNGLQWHSWEDCRFSCPLLGWCA